MRKFLVLEDVSIFNQVILKKDQIIEVENDYQINKPNLQLSLTIGELEKDERFQEIFQNLDIFINSQEIQEEEDLEVKRFRIQLDVTTSRKKLQEIEFFMRKTIQQML